MSGNLNSNNIEKDDFNVNTEEHSDYKDLLVVGGNGLVL